MTEFAVGDLVRVGPDAAPYTGKVGKVALVSGGVRHCVSVEMEFKGLVQHLAYAPDELELVRAVISAPRVVAVVV